MEHINPNFKNPNLFVEGSTLPGTNCDQVQEGDVLQSAKGINHLTSLFPHILPWESKEFDIMN